MTTVGWGIVGCGTIADHRIAPAIRGSDNGELVAFCSRSLERAAQFADRHGASRGYDDLADLIDDPDVQAVYVATPNANHAAETIALLAGGKHVLCDKPLATSAEDADRMIAAAASADRLLGVAYQMRYLPALAQLHELVHSGQFGNLLMLRTSFAFVNPPRDAWRQNKALAGGGPLMDLAPHSIDLMRWLAGEVVAVTARVQNLRFHYPVEDTAGAVLQFDSGAIGLMDVGYCYNEGSLSLHGTAGSARLDGAFGQFVDWDLQVTLGGETTGQQGRAERAYIDQIEDFGESVASEGSSARPAPVGGIEGLRGLEVIEAIYESSECGERVELED